MCVHQVNGFRQGGAAGIFLNGHQAHPRYICGTNDGLGPKGLCDGKLHVALPTADPAPPGPVSTTLFRLFCAL